MRALAAALALALAAAACSEGSIELRNQGTRPPDTFTFVEEGGGGAPSGGGGGTGGAPGGEPAPEGGGEPGAPGAAPPGGASGGGGESGGGGAPPAAVELDDRGRIGALGPALLRAGVPEVVVEIDTTPGESLVGSSRNALARQLGEHGSKEVSFAAGSSVPERDVYTTAELRSLMESHRSVWSTEGRAAVYVMVLSGRHENDGVVGVSFNASSFAIFTEQLGGGLLGLNYATYEEAVVVHELGHLFGLVNLTGHGAFHEDPAHPGHSTNQGSVMFWAVETTVVGDVFEGGPPRDFDADDEQEMAAIRAA